ncbi:MAG: HD domain-containing protein [Campylobacterales bacterium]|nr:HD domain-containing protein [Campylobacterales bacterium]
MERIIVDIYPESFPQPYQSLNEEGILIDVNDAWLLMLGYTRDEVIGKSFGDFLSNNEKDIFKNRFETFKAVGSVTGVEFLLRHKQGYYIGAYYNGKMTFNREGQKVSQCMFYNKTTDIEHEYIYKQLFNYSTNAIVLYSSFNNGEDFIFVDVNQKVEEFENIKKEEIIGKKVTEVFPSIKQTPLLEAFKTVYQTGVTKHIPLVLYQDEKLMGYKTNTVIKLPTDHLLVIYNDETHLEFSKRMLDTTVNTIRSIIFITLDGEELEWCNQYTLDKLGFNSIEELKKEHECFCDFFEEDRDKSYIGKEFEGTNWLYYTLYEQKTSTIKVKIAQRIYSLRCNKMEFDNQKRYLVVLSDITQLENSLLTIQKQTQRLIKNKEKIKANYESMMQTFVSVLEEKDSYTAGHSKRVAHYSKNIAQKMGLSPKDIDTVYRAGHLHDIGKIVTPESILLKPSSFNTIEYKLMQEHATIGYEILNQMDDYHQIAKIIKYHHEKYDGSGYPDGLSSNEIPLLSRIMTIADSFDAMTTNRVYKARMNIQEALEELEKNKGSHFDPDIIPYAISYFSQLEAIDVNSVLPKDSMSQYRFAYFFKDNLTNVYNAAYLDIFLTENLAEQLYDKCCIVDLHNLHPYNKKFSWEHGDKVLQRLAAHIIKIAQTTMIFRVQGDKFIVLLRQDREFGSCANINLPENLYVTFTKINLIDKKISSYRDLLAFMVKMDD